MKLSIGDVIENLKQRDRLSGVPDFKKGYYLVSKIRDGYMTAYLKDEDRKVYELIRCTKTGKPFKTMHPIFCKSIDKDIEEGKIVNITIT